MNSEIEEIFKDFKVDDVIIPISFLRYIGDKKTYLSYYSTSEVPVLNVDDKCKVSAFYITIDIYSDGDYINILKAVKENMKNNSWVWTGDSPDLYEEETKMYHKAVEFVKERNLE